MLRELLCEGGVGLSVKLVLPLGASLLLVALKDFDPVVAHAHISHTGHCRLLMPPPSLTLHLGRWPMF